MGEVGGAEVAGVASGPPAVRPVPSRLYQRDLVVMSLDLARRRPGVAGGGRGTGRRVVPLRRPTTVLSPPAWIASAWAVPSAAGAPGPFSPTTPDAA